MTLFEGTSCIRWPRMVHEEAGYRIDTISEEYKTYSSVPEAIMRSVGVSSLGFFSIEEN